MLRRKSNDKGLTARGSSVLLNSYQRAMFWRRLMLTAFFTVFVATMFWTIPWLPYGLSVEDYNSRVTMLIILLLMASISAFGAVYLRDISHRVEETLLNWASVNDGLSDLRRREYFFDRIILECSQSAQNQQPFAVIALRLSTATSSDTEKISRAIKALEPTVKEYDCLSSLGPHEIGVLAHHVAADQIETLTSNLAKVVAASFSEDDAQDIEVLAGYAVYPRDAIEAGALVGIARSRLMKQRLGHPPAATPAEALIARRNHVDAA